MAALTWTEFSKNIGHQFDGMRENPCDYHLDPFKIYGNLYYVGDKLACPMLLDTGEGLILIDTGFPGAQAMLVDSIYQLGFNPRNIKIVLHTHGHVDHYGATKFFQTVCGAKAYLHPADAELFKKYPETFEFEGEYVPPFQPDEMLYDGQVITLGNTSIRVVHTPGHSPGAVSFFFDVEENGRVLHAGLPGCIGRNTLFRHEFERLHYPESTPLDFLNSMDKIMDEPVQLWLGSHPTKYHNDGLAKRMQMIAHPDAPNPFIVDPVQWREYIMRMRDSMVGIVENGCI